LAALTAAMAAADIIMFESQNELDDDTGKQLLVVTTFLSHQRKPFAVQFFTPAHV